MFIFVDNQTAIKFFHRPKNQSGQYMLRCIVDLYYGFGRNVEIHWIPVYTGVPSNETTDVTAKKVAGWEKKPRATGGFFTVTSEFYRRCQI